MKTGSRKTHEPRLYGASEAAAALGVGQTNLRTVAGLPEPYDAVIATTLWRADEIDALAATRNARRKAAAFTRPTAKRRKAAA